MAADLRSEQPEHNAGLLQPPEDPDRGAERASSGAIGGADGVRRLRVRGAAHVSPDALLVARATGRGRGLARLRAAAGNRQGQRGADHEQADPRGRARGHGVREQGVRVREGRRRGVHAPGSARGRRAVG